MIASKSSVERTIESAVHELLDSRAEARIYVYLVRTGGARSDDIIRGTKLHPSTVRELLSRMYTRNIILRKKIPTPTIGKNPYLYQAVSPLLLLQRRVSIIEARLNRIISIANKTCETNKVVHITIAQGEDSP